MADYNSSYTGQQIDNAVAAGLAVRGVNGIVQSDGAGNVSAAVADEDYVRPLTGSASGGIAHFTDGAGGAPLKSLVVNITPVQTGSGDPSPSNVKPITGWTGARIKRTGKNLLDALAGFKYCREYDWNGTVVNINEQDKTVTFNATQAGSLYRGIIARAREATGRPMYPFKENTRYTFIFRATSSGTQFNIAVSYTDGTNSGGFTTAQADANGFVVFTTPAGKTVKLIYIGQYSGVSTFYYEDFGLFEGVVALNDFEPYQGADLSVSWQSEAGTVYGGRLEINEAGAAQLTTYPYYASYDGEALIGPWVSSKDVYAVGTTPTTGAQVVDLGGEGTVYDLTAGQIKTLPGQNNIWADCGDVAVEYWRSSGLLEDVQTMIDAAVLGAIGGSY